MTTDRDAEIERLKSLLASTQSDLARDSSRANEAARLAADARDELDTVRQQLADAKEQAGWCDNDRDRLSLALDDAKTEIERLKDGWRESDQFNAREVARLRTELAEAERSANVWRALSERWDRDHTNIVLPYTCKIENERDEARRELAEAKAQRRTLWKLLKESVRTTRDVIRTPTPRWDEDPVVAKFGWQEGRCGKCGEELPESWSAPTGSEERCACGTQLTSCPFCHDLRCRSCDPLHDEPECDRPAVSEPSLNTTEAAGMSVNRANSDIDTAGMAGNSNDPAASEGTGRDEHDDDPANAARPTPEKPYYNVAVLHENGCAVRDLKRCTCGAAYRRPAPGDTDAE